MVTVKGPNYHNQYMVVPEKNAIVVIEWGEPGLQNSRVLIKVINF